MTIRLNSVLSIAITISALLMVLAPQPDNVAHMAIVRGLQ